MALSQGNYPGDWLLKEFDQNYNREEITVVSGQDLVSGTVVGIVTGSGKYAAFEDDASDGTATAAGILVYDVDASGGDKKGVVLKRSPAVVSKAGLTWHSDNDATDKTNGLADLASLNIIAREGV